MATASSRRSMWFAAAALLAALLCASACGGDDDGGGGDGFDAAPDPRCIVDDGDPIPYMCPCSTDDDQCDTAAGDMCFAFNNKGPHCTRPCDGPEDCEAPSDGCNMMGVCRVPD